MANGLLEWAQQYAEGMANREGILGVMNGGSLAYFNVDDARGVELIQVEGGDAGTMLKWPIQLWQRKIFYDPKRT